MSRSIARLAPKSMDTGRLFYFIRTAMWDLREPAYLTRQQRQALCDNLESALEEIELRFERPTLSTSQESFDGHRAS